MPAGPRNRTTTDDSPDADIREFADAGNGGRVPESPGADRREPPGNRDPDRERPHQRGGMTKASDDLAGVLDANRLAERALEQLPGVGVVVFDEELRVRLAGGDALALGTGELEGLAGRRVRDVLPAEAALAATPHCRRALAGRA